MKKLGIAIISSVLIGLLAGCGAGSTAGKADKSIKIGATSGPYSDMVSKAIKPVLEKKGYKVEVVEFSDYIQPNLALSKGDLDANLFQHKIYLDTFNKEHSLELAELISVPTAPMGIYSKQFKTLEEIKDGSEIAIPNDPTNAARALLILEDAGLVKLDPSANPLTVSEKDVKENVKNLQFKPLEAAQLPRALDGTDLSAVPGNFALAAKMNLLDAAVLEKMADQYRNRVAVNEKDLSSEWAKDLKAAVESDEFEKTMDEDFKGFEKPEWMAD
ncbi:hypothetical protein GKZ89_10405 [Bacillus mangrovi]|uniref:Lipoprotein n=1 Tax=Metabacillus mangrovi TaxID=1491830 RepID=A0A7X2S5V8_9BACI|nr:MetQ/NlpA family ABC transporter substrate-binding protein [Metabacillus mangrovi]MTH53815.1 hypothetical protein [Metabacillus mangrovi]